MARSNDSTCFSGRSGRSKIRPIAEPASGGLAHPLFPARRFMLGRSRFGLALFFSLVLAACGQTATVDPSAPRVAETDPAPEATGVPLSASVHATFSGRIDPATMNTDTFIITGVSGEVLYQNQKATFTPSIPLANETTYHAVLTTGIKDLDGIPLASNFIWAFTTSAQSGGETADQTPPEIRSISPGEGTADAAVDAPIRVVFSESIRPETLHAGTFFVRGVSGEIRYDDAARTATLQPLTPLNLQTQYQATVTTGVTDQAGNPLAAARSWSFTTGPSADLTPPTVIDRRPTGKDVSIQSVVTVQFSEPIKPETLAGHFTLISRGRSVPGEIRYDEAARTATLTPSRLRHGTDYTVVLTHDVQDVAGNRLEHTSWSWRTENRPEESN